jgi:hypothetical protein
VLRLVPLDHCLKVAGTGDPEVFTPFIQRIMASLDSIPNELKDHVINDLSFADKLALIKTSRSLHAAAIPALYRDISVHSYYKDPNSLNSLSITKRFNTTRILCRTLVERPDLAKHVQTFEACDGPEIGPKSRIYEGKNSLFEKSIDRLPLPAADRLQWKKDLSLAHRKYVAVLFLALALCPRLDRLSISCEHMADGTGLWRLLRTKMDALSQLSSVRVVGSDEDSPFHPFRSASELIFSHPKLEVLQFADSWEHGSHDFSLERIAPLVAETRVPGTLTAFSVQRAAAHSDYLWPVLRLMPALRTLECDFLYHIEERGPLNMSTLKEGLELARTTLVHLILRFHINDDDDEGLRGGYLEDVVYGKLGSLRQFAALTTLETSLALMFGQDDFALKHPSDLEFSLASMLPPNLRKLTITDDLWGVNTFKRTDEIFTMAVFKNFFVGECVTSNWRTSIRIDDTEWEKLGDALWKTSTPKLEEFVLDIRLKRHHYPYWNTPITRDELHRVCESQGIKCTILS